MPEPSKEAGLPRDKFEEVVRLATEAIDDLKLEAQAKSLLEGVFGEENELA